MTFTLICALTFRFHSDNAINRPGFQLEYSSIALFTVCGGNYTNASGILTSPSYPKPYPRLTDCIYLISQPNGMYVTITFITVYINCQKTRSSHDYIEIRDGNSEDSPLMLKFCGNNSDVPAFIQTTQNHLRLR